MDVGVSLPTGKREKNNNSGIYKLGQKQPVLHTVLVLTYFLFKQEAGVGHINASSSFKHPNPLV